jgi:hypothetical protein
MRDGSRALRTRRGAGSSGARIVQGAREACPSQMGGETLKPSATGAVSAAASPRGDSTHSSRPWTWVGGDVASTAVNSVRMRRRVRHRPAPAQRRAALEIPPLPEGWYIRRMQISGAKAQTRWGRTELEPTLLQDRSGYCFPMTRRTRAAPETFPFQWAED